MISPFSIYLVGIMDNIRDMLTGATYLSVIATAIVGIALIFVTCVASTGDADVENALPTLRKIALIIFACLLFFAPLRALCPDSKTLAGMYIIPKVVNSEFVQKQLPADAQQVYGLAVKALTEQLKECSGDKGEVKK